MGSVRLCLAILVVGACWVSAQDQPYTVRVDVTLVSVDVGVFDSAGRHVPGLIADDFLIFEDDKPQKIRNFGSADSPYDLLLLLDCSESTTSQWPLLQEATARLVRGRRPEDRTMIAAFGTSVQVIRDWNSKKERRLDRSLVCGGTHFYETLRWAVYRLQGLKSRKGVVFLTDGVDGAIPTRTLDIAGQKVMQFVDPEADREFQKALRFVRKSGIPLYFVAVPTDRYPSPTPQPALEEAVMADVSRMRSRLDQLALASGGHVVFPKRPEDVTPMFEKIVQELGTSYSIGYTPNPHADGKRHKITVRLRSGDFQLLQSREFYDSK